MEWLKPVNGQIPAGWYGWVDQFSVLGSKVVGVENRERFGYFNLSYHWLKAEVLISCTLFPNSP